MNELANLVNMKPITTCVLIDHPNGKWGFVGNVPVELAFVDATPELLRAAKFGAQFGPKTRVFDTAEEAAEAAAALGVVFKRVGE